MSALLLGALLLAVDARAAMAALAGADAWWFAAAMAMFVPILWAAGERWRLVARPLAPISSKEAVRQVLAASSLNLVLPSKLGDLAKGFFLQRRRRCTVDQGVHVVVFEKCLDLAALCALALAGWILMPRFEPWALLLAAAAAAGLAAVVLGYGTRLGPAVVRRFAPEWKPRGRAAERVRRFLAEGPATMRLVRARGRRLAAMAAWSLGIWMLHLAQIAFFLCAVDAGASFGQVAAWAPLAVLAGLAPVTIAGVGVRDWAIVALFAAAGADPAALAAGGLLVSLRYVVPAAAGQPWIGRYFAPLP